MYYDLDVCDLSAHETRVLKELSAFITHHQPGASLSAIDNIVLMYVVGVLDDLGNEDDFDVDTFLEMIGAYVPGFESIEIALVCEWIFSLSEKLKKNEEAGPTSTAEVEAAPEIKPPLEKDVLPSKVQLISGESAGPRPRSYSSATTPRQAESEESFDGDLSLDYLPDPDDDLSLGYLPRRDSPVVEFIWDPIDETSELQKHDKSACFEQVPNDASDRARVGGVGCISNSHRGDGLTHVHRSRTENGVGREQVKQVLDVIPGADLEQVEECLSLCRGVLNATVAVLMERMNLGDPGRGGDSDKMGDQVFFKTKTKQSGRDRRHRRKSRKASGGGPDTNSKTYKENVIPVEEAKNTCMPEGPGGADSERLLLEMFPSASPVDPQQCLAISKGVLDVASQLLMEKINSGEFQSKPRVYPLQNSNKAVDDKKQREMLLQKYGFIDAEEGSREHRPFLPKPEKDKLVRYYDSKPVSSKGEKFFEVKEPT